MSQNPVSEFYHSMPPVTRTLLFSWLTLAVGVIFLPSIAIPAVRTLAIDWPKVTGKLQLWRLVTGFLWNGSFQPQAKLGSGSTRRGARARHRRPSRTGP